MIQLSNGFYLHMNLFTEQIIHLMKLESKSSTIPFIQLPMPCYQTWIVIPQRDALGFTMVDWSNRNKYSILQTNYKNRIQMMRDEYWTMGDSNVTHTPLKPYSIPFTMSAMAYHPMAQELVMAQGNGTLHRMSLF